LSIGESIERVMHSILGFDNFQGRRRSVLRIWSSSRRLACHHREFGAGTDEGSLMVGRFTSHNRSQPAAELRHVALEVVDVPEQRDHDLGCNVLCGMNITQ
jgi:hypothetical protein